MGNNNAPQQRNNEATRSKNTGGRSQKNTSPMRSGKSGNLRIGDNWNAITIIALSQNNPLKAIAEFVENSIDANAKKILIARGKERGEQYLKIIDDGEGIPLNKDGEPDFRYVATHICDSLKRRLKEKGARGIQGEFGIGLLSFWTVGERMLLSSAGKDNKTFQMEMWKQQPGYSIMPRRALFTHGGTELTISPLLPGIRQLSGEKIQNYLASELRDRIRKTGVEIVIKDRSARKELEVRPREYTGNLLREFDKISTAQGDIRMEFYLNAPSPENEVGLFRAGTRVLPRLAVLDHFAEDPWTSGYVQGMIDVPFLQITPGTRDGIIRDDSYELFCAAIEPASMELQKFVDQARRSEEEEASKSILKSVRRASKEAFVVLPPDDYGWLEIKTPNRGNRSAQLRGVEPNDMAEQSGEVAEGQRILDPSTNETIDSRQFYEHAGPLYSVVISPASAVIPVGESRDLRCIPRDRSKRMVESDLYFEWKIEEGDGELSGKDREMLSFKAPSIPCLTILEVTVTQEDKVCTAKAILTITDTLIPKGERGNNEQPSKGLPGYTFQSAPGKLWRSRYDRSNNVVVINSAHKDFVYAAQKRTRKLKYICKLFAKELVLHNFPGYESEELLERMTELTLYTEEHLR